MPDRWNLEQIEIGQSARFSKTISEADLVLFTGVTGDTNPLFLDEEHALDRRFPGRFAHPAMVIGLMHTAFSARLPGMTGGMVTEASYRFFAPLHLGDTASAAAEVIKLDREAKRVTVGLSCTNQNGGRIAEGEVLLLPPMTPGEPEDDS